MVVELSSQHQLGGGREAQQDTKVVSGRISLLDALNDLRLKIDDLQADPDQIDFGDVALLESDGVDFEDACEPVAILLRDGQPPLSQLHPVIGVLQRKAELPDGVLEIRLRRLGPEGGALDPIPALAGHLKQLLDSGINLTAALQPDSP